MGYSLRMLSKEVFSLDEINQQILRCLAITGPKDLISIEQWVNRVIDDPPGREGLKNIIFGNTVHKGLIKTEYIFSKKFNEKQRKYSLYLLPKGIIASFATTDPKNNWFFKEIIEHADKNTKGKKYKKFLEKYILSQISFFLAYHYEQGLELTWQKNTIEYYSDFMEKLKVGFRITLKDVETNREFNEVVEKYVIQYNMLQLLTSDAKKTTGGFPGIFDSDLISLDVFDKKNWVNSVYNWYVSYKHNIIPEYKKQFSDNFEELKKIRFSTYEINWKKLIPVIKEQIKLLK
jgi:hypothetical protein